MKGSARTFVAWLWASSHGCTPLLNSSQGCQSDIDWVRYQFSRHGQGDSPKTIDSNGRLSSASARQLYCLSVCLTPRLHPVLCETRRRLLCPAFGHAALLLRLLLRAVAHHGEGSRGNERCPHAAAHDGIQRRVVPRHALGCSSRNYKRCSQDEQTWSAIRDSTEEIKKTKVQFTLG